MKRNFWNSLKNILKKAASPAFIIFVILSFCLWYINKLSHTYSATVKIPIKIESSEYDQIGVVSGNKEIECRMQGRGYRLMRYRMFPKNNAVTIDVGQLELTPIEGSIASEVSINSIFNALTRNVTDVNILSVTTSRFEIITAPLKSKKVPVLSRINVAPRDRFAQRKAIMFEPDSVNVKSMSVLVDTLKGIYTEPLNFSDVHGYMSGFVNLPPIQDLIISETRVEYSIIVEEFTEMSMTLPVEVRGYPESLKPIVIPESTNIKVNVFRSSYSGAVPEKMKAYIDYAEKETNIDGNHYKIYVETEEGIEVKDISPLYVRLFFESEE